MPRFFEGHGVGARAIFLTAKGAQPAGCHTNVGWVDVAVDIEISNVAVQAFAYNSLPTNLRRAHRPTVEGNAIVEIETLVCRTFSAIGCRRGSSV